jgi:hypothetical protein
MLNYLSRIYIYLKITGTVRGRGYTGTVLRVRGYGRRAAGTRARVRVQRVFSKKKTDRPFSNPYSFTRLYPGTGTNTAGTGRGYTGKGCTRRVLANH